MSNKVIKSVSLNVMNKDDAAILKAVKRRNFSGYVKGLIMADIRARNTAQTDGEGEGVQIQREEVERPQTAAQRLEELQRKRSGQHAPAPFINQRRN